MRDRFFCFYKLVTYADKSIHPNALHSLPFREIFFNSLLCCLFLRGGPTCLNTFKYVQVSQAAEIPGRLAPEIKVILEEAGAVLEGHSS